MIEGEGPARSTNAETWFVTRKYPPRIGGMELLSWELTTRFAKRRRTRVFSLRHGSLLLPLFLTRCALSIVAGGVRRRIAILHLGDPVLAPLGRLAKLFGVPTCVTVHGLDVTYAHPLYRLWLRMFFHGFDTYICLSRATRAAAVAGGVPEARTRIVGLGVAPPPAAASAQREADLLLFVGRLVRRKGLEWFVRSVLPKIAERRPAVRLAVVGAGPERRAIRQAAVAAGVADRIDWLGAVTHIERAALLLRAAVCIVPNVDVPGDVEGYGIVALEAAASGCALVAADLHGLRDAVVDGEGGLLIAAEDADAWTRTVVELLDDPQRATALGARARAWALSERSWNAVCDRYEDAFNAIA
jgi:glycosyltransferase involved in cell wall biosynthesis